MQLENPRSADDLLPDASRRFIPALAAILIGIALFGFLRGIGDRNAPVRSTVSVSETPSEGIPSAVTYLELPITPSGVSGNQRENLSSLKFDRPGIFDPVVRTESMKLDALADRARNRAYDGAPPTIPHPVEQQSALHCLTCHGEGIKVGNRMASKVSHSHFSNCTQCHVEQNRSSLASASEPTENTFHGLARSGPGTRASPGAPPTIPHSTWLREDCMSCHGLLARPGIRTTHPWLSNCTQCHASAAERDQVDFLRVFKEADR